MADAPPIAMHLPPLPSLQLDPEVGVASGTRVHTPLGLEPIEAIRPGHWVLTQPPGVTPPSRRRTAQETIHRQVVDVRTLQMPAAVRITVCNMADGIEDSFIAGTGQPVWIHNTGWVPAAQVRPTQAVVLSFYGNAMVRDVQPVDGPIQMHWLELAEGDGVFVETLGSWIGNHDSTLAEPAPPPAPVDWHSREPQVLVSIPNYYNDTLEGPPAATGAAALPAAPSPVTAEGTTSTSGQPVLTEDADLTQRMSRAAERLREMFQREAQVELRYDEASIEWLDCFIEHRRQRDSDPGRDRLIHAIGAFLGECTRQQLGGHWGLYQDMAGIQLPTGSIVFPLNKTAKQFDNGRAEGDSILGLLQSMQSLEVARAQERKPLGAVQQRLIEHHQTTGRRVFVPGATCGADGWVPITAVEGHRATMRRPGNAMATVEIDLHDVSSYFVCDPVGRLLDSVWITTSMWPSLPDTIREQLMARLPKDVRITPEQLVEGQKRVRVSFTPSPGNPDGHYATRLTNLGETRVRIVRFGGFTASEAGWELSNATRDFYSPDEFRDWYGQTEHWIEPGQTVVDIRNWGRPPVIWAYWGVTDRGDAFVTGDLLEALPGSLLPGSRVHHVTPTSPQPQMGELMAQMRSSFAQRQQRMSTLSLQSVLGARPAWMQSDDPLDEVFRQQSLLLTEGHVVWAAMVQANNRLFKPGDEADCPADYVHGEDAYFDERTLELHQVARALAAYKHTQPRDPGLRSLAEHLTGERARAQSELLPRALSAQNVRLSTCMVFRKHIPQGVLTNTVLPMLVHPATPAVMLLPFEFWPIGLIMRWKANTLLEA